LRIFSVATTTVVSKGVAGLRAQLGDRGLARQRGPVGARRRHRVVGVGHRDDARRERDLVADEAVRVMRVAFRFTPLNGSQWRVDDVYVDPYRTN
jgi:hypothetical protein